MAYIYFSESDKQTANSTDLVSYLQTHGESVKRTGREYVWDAPSGKVSINGSEWYSQYEQTGGGAILFLRKFFGMTFPEAVTELLGGHVNVSPISAERKQPEKERKPFELPLKNSDMRRLYGYLMNERFIGRDVINTFVRADLLYEEPDFHNIVFIGKNTEGLPVHAHKRSSCPTSSFKNNVEGSTAEYSFHWNGTSDRLYVFEAPIDMLAYITLHKDNWQQHSYVSLCSTADRAAVQMLKDNKNLRNIYLCLDHDSAGIEGSYRLAEIIKGMGDYSLWRAFPTNKDWDEDLKALHGKEAIPASEHARQQAFMRTIEELSSELDPSISGESVGKYKGKMLCSLVKYHLEHEDYLNAGKALAMGCTVSRCFGTYQDVLEKAKKTYQPHRDHESVSALGESINKKLSTLEARLTSPSAMTETERNALYSDMLGLAVDCFRQCGNIQESEKEDAISSIVL